MRCKIYHFKQKSVAVSTVILLYNHHNHPSLELLYHPKLKFYLLNINYPSPGNHYSTLCH